MPAFDYICEICGTPGRAWRPKGQPPRFCSRACRKKGIVKGKKPKYVITPEMHREIEKTYKDITETGEVRKLAERLGLPRYKITKYAQLQGWIPMRKKEPDWSERELRILESSAHLSPERIQKNLKRVGYHRTVTGIVLKRKRMRFLKNKGGHSAHQVAACFGVDVKCITRWISLGYLKARRRGTARTSRQGGDIYYIKDAWIRDFIVNAIDEIDIRKVDKYWFVDLLAGKNLGIGECKIKNLDSPGEPGNDDDNDEFKDLDTFGIFTEAANY